MFGWRKRQIADKVDKDMNDTETPSFPEVDEPLDTDDAHYTIGINSAGMTQLRMNGTGYGAITLTMNANAVRSMIRQLDATLPQEQKETT